MSAAGTWNVTVNTPMGAQQGTLVIAVDGDSFTGTLSSGMMGTLETKGGKVSGDTLTWKMDMTVPMPMSLDGEATITGDSLSGAVKAGAFGSMALSGTRG